jgi:2,3-bisphosphoglycerate-dependent phosphoglycerate mutase
MSNDIQITLMRHGRSRADDEGVHEGRYDSPLTEIGISQVQARADEFLRREFIFDKIIASTMIVLKKPPILLEKS